MSTPVALVTGAGMANGEHGIGSATAAELASQGYAVAVLDRVAERAEACAEQIREVGGQSLPVVADISEGAAVEMAVDIVERRLGRVEVLVNNAAIAVPGGLLDTSVTDWRRSLEVNLTGMFLLTRAVLPGMLAAHQTDGEVRKVINVGAVAGRRWTGAPMISYSCSKGAIEPFTRSVALEYASRGIRANCVLPGLMDTPFYREPLKHSYEAVSLQEISSTRDAQSPTGAQGSAWDIAHAVVFLASKNADYVNGHALVVDGGQSAQTWAGGSRKPKHTS